MGDRALCGLAGVVGATGMVLLYAEARIGAARLTSETIPAWVVFGTAGQSVTAYSALLSTFVHLAIVSSGMILGYHASRDRDLTREHRSFARTVALGSSLGVVLVALGALWPSITSIGGHSAGTYGAKATEMLIMDVVLMVAILARYLAEVALLITVGALAGAAMAHFGTGDSSLAAPEEGASDSSTVGDDSTNAPSQPR